MNEEKKYKKGKKVFMKVCPKRKIEKMELNKITLEFFQIYYKLTSEFYTVIINKVIPFIFNEDYPITTVGFSKNLTCLRYLFRVKGKESYINPKSKILSKTSLILIILNLE